MKRLELNKRQQKTVLYVKTNGKITNQGLRELTNVTARTASRDLENLVRKGVLLKVGNTGRSTHYVLVRNPDINRTNRTSVLFDAINSSVYVSNAPQIWYKSKDNVLW